MLSIREQRYRQLWAETHRKPLVVLLVEHWQGRDWFAGANQAPMSDVGAKAREIIREREAKRVYLPC